MTEAAIAAINLSVRDTWWVIKSTLVIWSTEGEQQNKQSGITNTNILKKDAQLTALSHHTADRQSVRDCVQQ